MIDPTNLDALRAKHGSGWEGDERDLDHAVRIRAAVDFVTNPGGGVAET